MRRYAWPGRLATGSEVALAVEARSRLQAEGISTAVVSMPSWELFEMQNGAYRAQILPDGGHVTRNPGALIEVLLDLLPLRQAFAACNIAPPAQLNNAIDRTMPMLRFWVFPSNHFRESKTWA